MISTWNGVPETGGINLLSLFQKRSMTCLQKSLINLMESMSFRQSYLKWLSLDNNKIHPWLN